MTRITSENNPFLTSNKNLLACIHNILSYREWMYICLTTEIKFSRKKNLVCAVQPFQNGQNVKKQKTWLFAMQRMSCIAPHICPSAFFHDNATWNLHRCVLNIYKPQTEGTCILSKWAHRLLICPKQTRMLILSQLKHFMKAVGTRLTQYISYDDCVMSHCTQMSKTLSTLAHFAI